MTEWAALQLLSEQLGSHGLAPRFYGGDAAVPLVVMEDLGDGTNSPYELVEGDDPEAATASLVAYIREVARLHMTTRGLGTEYARLREALGSPSPAAALYHDPWADAHDRLDAEIRRAADEYRTALAAAGLDAGAAVDDEIAEVTSRVECTPGPWLALCQGDQNGLRHCMLAQGELRLYDFGVAGFRHALLEGLPHRTTWGCIRRVPRDVIEAMDDAHREAVVAADPSLAADYAHAAATALARWHIFLAVWRLPPALARDRPRGPTTLRQQVIAGLDAFVAAEGEQPHYPGLRRAASDLAERLRRLWPAETHAVPYLPAYRAR
jgi:hypothetical protein